MEPTLDLKKQYMFVTLRNTEMALRFTENKSSAFFSAFSSTLSVTSPDHHQLSNINANLCYWNATSHQSNVKICFLNRK